MRTSVIVLLVLMSTLMIYEICSKEIQQQGIDKIGKQQKDKFKQQINGRTLTGTWGCAQSLFFQPTQCNYFSIPKQTKQMIIQPSQFNTPITFFSFTNTGHIQGFFYTQSSNKDYDNIINNNQPANHLYLLLYRDKYRTGQIIQLDIDLSKAQKFQLQPQKNHTKMVAWQQQNLITTANLYQNEKLFVKFDLAIDLEVFVVVDDGGLERIINDAGKLKAITTPIHVRIFSNNISIVTQLTSPSNNHILMILFIFALIQTIFICLNPAKSLQQSVSKTRSIMFRISQWFILQMHAFIIVFSKEYIQIGLKWFDTDLGYLIFLGLGNVGIGLLFLRKYQMVLEKFTNGKNLLVGVVFFSVYWYLASRYFHDGFFWVIELTIIMQLQILHSMANGGKGGLPYDLMGFMIVSRLPFIYMQLTESNIWNMPPMQTSYMKVLIGVFVVHGIIILLQSIKGGQFLVPNSIIPGYYNYYFTKSTTDPLLQQQCPICTCTLNKPPDSIEMTETIDNTSSLHPMQSGQQIQIIQSSKNDITTEMKQHKKTNNNKQNHDKVKIMKTPCNHIFHIDCLTKWMHNKLVCPYCRSTLPQLAELEKQ